MAESDGRRRRALTGGRDRRAVAHWVARGARRAVAARHVIDDITARATAAAARARVDAFEADAGQVAGALGVGGALAARRLRLARYAEGHTVHHATGGAAAVVVTRIGVARVAALRGFCRWSEDRCQRYTGPENADQNFLL